MACEKWAYAVESSGDADADVVGMQPVGDEQAGQQIVGGELGDEAGRMDGSQVHDPGKPGAIQLADELQELDGLVEHSGVDPSLELVELALDGVADRSVVPHAQAKSSWLYMVGEWTLFSTWPLPRYMWTPHGRHGSKLRTVRMMSMPLKWSRSFSSKIGQPCTASS